jgi:two-component system, OmpR family, sensor histidine kinase KdpD
MLGADMRSIWSLGRPYAAAVIGVAAITALIGAVRPWLDLPNLGAAYLILVLWLAARHGWPPALSAALLAFLSYNWFFVPPYGTLWISAPRDLLNLVILLVAALAGGRLVSSLAGREARAVADAQESGILNEIAIAALRDPGGDGALSILCERAVSAAGIERITLLAEYGDDLEVVAGAALPERERAEARAALEQRANVGACLRQDQIELLRTFPATPGLAFVLLTGGVAAIKAPRARLSPDNRRLLAALLGLAGLLLDRRWGAAIAERARDLEASNSLKAAILSSISHEVKSPIAALRAGLTTLVMPEAGLREDHRELAAGLDQQASRLDRLVGDLLTMSRLEAGIPPERQPQDVADLVGTVLHALQPRLARFEVSSRISPDLPAVLADELQVERVLTNLLENAMEWTPPGGRIRIGAEAAGDRVEVWVDNDGARIAPADLDQVFDTFWTRRRGGSGLGLAICRRIVDAHGGAIRAENQAEGARFLFELPVAGRMAETPAS